jgi:hypothetical protein
VRRSASASACHWPADAWLRAARVSQAQSSFRIARLLLLGLPVGLRRVLDGGRPSESLQTVVDPFDTLANVDRR